MPPQRRARRNQGPQGPQCNQPACVSTRQRLGTMCAARACTQRELESLEAEMALMRARNGGDGRMGPNARRVEPGGDAATQRENQGIIKSRIRAVYALIEKINSAVSAARDPILKAIEGRVEMIQHQLATGEGDIDPEIVAEYHTLEMEASKMRMEKQPMECGICLEPIDPKTHMYGKNCVHCFCMGCIATLGFAQAKPGWQVHDNPWWEHTGHQVDFGPNGEGVVHEYRIRAEHLEEDGTTPKVLPTDIWVRCPECRDPHFADAAFFQMYKQAHANLEQDDAEPAAPKQPVEVITEMVAAELLLLVDAPKAESYQGTDLVVAVEAKIPGTSDHGGFPRGPPLGAILRLAGFELDKKVKTTGSGWVREKSRVIADGFTVHPLDFRGGSLTETKPQRKRKFVEIADAPDGSKRQEQQWVTEGGGFFKFAYPPDYVPVVVVGDNNSEAGPSGEGPSPLNADAGAEVPGSANGDEEAADAADAIQFAIQAQGEEVAANN